MRQSCGQSTIEQTWSDFARLECRPAIQNILDEYSVSHVASHVKTETSKVVAAKLDRNSFRFLKKNITKVKNLNQAILFSRPKTCKFDQQSSP